MTDDMILQPMCPHCEGQVLSQRHCANEQCTWYVCTSCRKTTAVKIQEV